MAKSGKIKTSVPDDIPIFELVVIDEAHHFYRSDKNRELVEPYLKPATRLLILSDLSQSDGLQISYPSSMQVIELTEVVRCSERVVAGARQFQLGGSAKLLTSCQHKSVGPPLRSFLFDAKDDTLASYASQVMAALKSVITDFPKLSLHGI